MKKVFTVFSLSLVYLSAVVLSGCGQSSAPPPAAPVNPTPQSLQQPYAPPQQPQQLSLYMVPLDQAGFSMEKIQADKKKVELEPNNVPALIGLGDANFMIQRFEKSQEYYERAVKADPKNINARLSLSNTYIFMQKPDEAIKQLDQILAVQKDHPESLFNKGLILLQSKRDTAGAKQSWTQLIGAHPDHPLAQEVKAELGRL
ncbi:MAG: tetratricopeptide repeat protein [Nitrospirae bacterium]|nr:tetratricopeptide repeat protein [Nitrospirota bacterium]